MLDPLAVRLEELLVVIVPVTIFPPLVEKLLSAQQVAGGAWVGQGGQGSFGACDDLAALIDGLFVLHDIGGCRRIGQGGKLFAANHRVKQHTPPPAAQWKA